MHAPSGPIFFIFMQFPGKIGQTIGWHPLQGLVHPPLGNPGSATDQEYPMSGMCYILRGNSRNKISITISV